jgi:serine/threonine protein phosphatase PrpC
VTAQEHGIQLKACGLSDAGRANDSNEDAFLASEQEGLVIVSDGIGGARAGSLASAMVVQALPLQISVQRLARRADPMSAAPAAVAAELTRAIGCVNDMILARSRDHPEVRGLGATVVAGSYCGEGILVLAHLGDSRAYLMRRGYLERLTSDHTVAEMLLQSGRINRRQLRRHPSRHVLTRHLGKEDCPPADVAWLALKPGDRVLLCTDGLSGMLRDREIGTLLWARREREAVCRLLIDRANNAGGRDNITALIVDVVEAGRRRGRRRRRVVVRRAVGRSLARPAFGQEKRYAAIAANVDEAKGNRP